MQPTCSLPAAPGTFSAGIWTDVGNLPGVEAPGASWNLASVSTKGDLVRLSGITGVTPTGGVEYFMVIGPRSASDSSENAWNWSNQGLNGLVGERRERRCRRFRFAWHAGARLASSARNRTGRFSRPPPPEEPLTQGTLPLPFVPTPLLLIQF
jgi:hypothetical protein